MTQRHNVQTQFGDYLKLMNISDPYPDYTRGERIADGAVLEPNFGGKPYAQGMPAGFQGIIKSMSLL